MTLLRRNTAADFVRDVGARTNGSRVWAAVLNADNTTYSINLTVNGVTTVKYSKVFWPGTQEVRQRMQLLVHLCRVWRRRKYGNLRHVGPVADVELT